MLDRFISNKCNGDSTHESNDDRSSQYQRNEIPGITLRYPVLNEDTLLDFMPDLHMGAKSKLRIPYLNMSLSLVANVDFFMLQF